MFFYRRILELLYTIHYVGYLMVFYFLTFFVFNPTFYHYRMRDTLIFTYYLVYNRKKIVIIFGFVKNALVDTSTSS